MLIYLTSKTWRKYYKMLAIGILDMNHIISSVNLRAIFGHIANEENFWTEI